MRSLVTILATAIAWSALTLTAFACSDEPVVAPPATCTNGVPGGVNCIVTKQDLKEARKDFQRGLKLREENQLQGAFAQFDQASHIVPQNFQFLTAREQVKALLVFNHMERGNTLMLMLSPQQAAAEFRAALDLDPDDAYAMQRLQDATRETRPPVPVTATVPQFDYPSEIELQPKNDRATFHFRGDIRGLYTELATAYGVKAQFDDAVPTKQVRFTVDDVDFFTALKLAGQVSKTMWAPLDAHTLYVAVDNPENHKQYDRMSLEKFILPPHATPQEATDFVTTMRNMFDLRFITSGQTSGTVEVRGPAASLKACAEMLAQLDNERPQVMLDVQVIQLDHQLTRNIGIHTPNTFTLYNIPAAALAGLAGAAGGNISQLVNQLISSGGINQAGSSALSGILAQLGGQSNSIFNTPLATFGGGLTFMGLSLDQITTTLSLNDSWVRSLESVTMRASQGNDATFHLGERYPVLNASYAPISNSPAIAGVLGNQSYQAPFPSVSYEDLGINLKAKPTIQGDNAVSMQLELQVRSLTGESNNGVPVISNKEYKGSINLKDGEPAVVAGEVSYTDTLSMSGIPGFGAIPLLNQAMVNNTKSSEQDELMIVITPHIIANIRRTNPEIWLTGKTTP